MEKRMWYLTGSHTRILRWRSYFWFRFYKIRYFSWCSSHRL